MGTVLLETKMEYCTYVSEGGPLYIYDINKKCDINVMKANVVCKYTLEGNLNRSVLKPLYSSHTAREGV